MKYLGNSQLSYCETGFIHKRKKEYLNEKGDKEYLIFLDLLTYLKL